MTRAESGWTREAARKFSAAALRFFQELPIACQQVEVQTMNTKINGVDVRPVSVGSGQPVSRTREVAGGDDQAGAAAGHADVSITDGARQLATLEKTIATLPVVDEAKVAATSLAIEQGRYQVDAHRIADKLIHMDYELSQAGDAEK